MKKTIIRFKNPAAFYMLLLLLTVISLRAQSPAADPLYPSANNNVKAIVWDSINNRIYLGGSFSSVAGIARQKFAAIDAATGSLLSWSITCNGDIETMRLYNGMLYIGGAFTTVSGQTRNGIARLDVNAQTLTSWAPNVGSTVYDIEAAGTYVFAGGSFSGPPSYLARIDTGTAAISSWTAGLNSSVSDLEISGTDLYAAGFFTSAGGQSRNYIAAYNTITATPSLDLTWDPAADAAVYTLKSFGGQLYASGNFSFIGNALRTRFASLQLAGTTGNANALDLQLDSRAMDIQCRSNSMFISGLYTQAVVNSTTFNRNSLMEFDLGAGTVSLWNPSAANTYIGALALSTGKVHAGGLNLSTGGHTNYAVFCANFSNPISSSISFTGTQSDICAGQTVPASFSVSSGSGADSYTWSNSLSGITITNGTTNAVSMDFSGASAGSNTITVSGSNGCISTNTVTSTVNVYNFTSLIGAASTGLNTSINGSITCGSTDDLWAMYTYPQGGTVSFSWSPGADLNATTTSTVTTSAKTNTTYTLITTTTDGCSYTDTMTLSVNPFTLSTGASPVSITCGQTSNLSVTSNYPGAGAVSYTWTPSGSLSSASSTSPAASPTTSTVYTVSAGASDGCAASPQVLSLTVNTVSLTASAASGSITCGNADNLSASSDYSGSGTLSYAWAPAAGLSNTSVPGPVATPTSTTVYTVSITSTEGCTSSASVMVTVNPLSVSVAPSFTSTCNVPAVLSAADNSGNAGLVYAWVPATGLNNTASAAPSATPPQTTSYTVTVSLPSSGCASASASAIVNIDPPVTPQICMVTVDTASTHNIVYWDKTGLTGIDSFRIYREDVTNVYTHIGSVAFDSLSEYHDYDPVADPNTTTKRYKLSAVDSCGNESGLSNYHNTIYIVYVGSGQFTWNPLYTIENSANPVNNYVLMRDDNSTGVWNQVASTAGTQSTIVDPNYAAYPNASYFVQTVWGITCSPMRAIINSSRSNLKNMAGGTTTGIQQADAVKLTVAPNPFESEIIITSPARIISIELYNSIGQLLFSERMAGSTQFSIPAAGIASGVYHLQVNTEAGRINRKLIKE